jgi:hypothetical protein
MLREPGSNERIGNIRTRSGAERLDAGEWDLDGDSGDTLVFGEMMLP